MVKDGDGNERAVCNHCQKSFVGSSKSGTTHLKNHLKCCRGKLSEEGNADEETCVIDPLEVVKMIVKCGFTLKSIKTDVCHLYRVEKEKLCRCLSELSCRITFTIDALWIPFDNYMCVACYFVDDSWQLKNKILGLKYLEREEDTLDTLKVNIDDVDEIKSWLSDRSNLIPVNGELLQFGYLVDILTSKNVSEIAFEVIQKIRGLFQYVFATLSNENKFQKAVEKAKSLGKKGSSEYVNPTTLVFNDFKLLETAVEFKEAFDELEQIDSDFKSINLTKPDWNEAVAVCQCWQELNDFPRSFPESIFPPVHLYFSKVCEIYTILLLWEKKESCSVRQIGSSLKRKFVDEYWKNSISVLAIMVVLDPRFKTDIIEHWYKKIYGSDHEAQLRKIIDEITNVYNEYMSSGIGDNASSSASHKMSGHPGDDVD